MTNRLQLKIDCGQGNVLVYTCDAAQAYLVGSGEDCNLCLQGSGISRRHCRIEKQADGWILTDLASTNGVIVNGQRLLGEGPREICAARLSEGDRLVVGTLQLTVQLVEDCGATQLLLVPPPVQLTAKAKARESSSHEANTEEKSSGQKYPLKEHCEKAELPSDVDSSAAVETEHKKMPRRIGNLVLRKKVAEDEFGYKYLASREGEPRKIFFVRLLYLSRLRERSDEARLQRSISLLQGLQHRAIVRYVDSGEEGDFMYVAMEYCNGGSLKKLFQSGVKLNYRRALRLMDRILSGMELAHVNGIVHRNLSPSSILLERTDDHSFLPKITDFSLAKRFLPGSAQGVTTRGIVGGQWCYMPREQLVDFSHVLPQADVWSLGAILYESLTNRPPRPIPEGASPLNTILYSDAIPIQLVLPEIPKELMEFVQRCLATEPSERYQNAMQMRAAMRSVAERLGIPLG